MSNKPLKEVASIMLPDIVGYTELTSKNEEVAFNLIKKIRELLLPLVKKHPGKLIKEIGDGTLTRYFDEKDTIQYANSFQSQTNDDFISDLKNYDNIEVRTNSMSNQLFGDFDNLMSILKIELEKTFKKKLIQFLT